MKDRLLKELQELDLAIAKLTERRGHVTIMVRDASYTGGPRTAHWRPHEHPPCCLAADLFVICSNNGPLGRHRPPGSLVLRRTRAIPGM
jgi:hypothetical protein